MPAFSRQVIQWIEELHKPRRLREVVTGASDERALYIRRLGNSGEVLAAPYLLPFLLEPALEVGTAAAIHELMENATEEEIIQLYEGRSYPLGLDHAEIGLDFRREWYELSPDQVPRFRFLGPASVWGLGLASFHGNGHVRQAAVEELGRLEDPRAVPFLLLRVNDWVRKVRTLARKLLEARLEAGRMADFSCTLNYLRRLARGGRDDHGPFIAKVHSALIAEPDLSALRAAAASKNRYVRREAFDLAWQREDEAISALLDLALDDEDVVVRVRGAQRALKTDDPSHFLDTLRGDPASAVRKLYVDFVADELGGSGDLLLPFLLDDHGGVRADARFYLSKQGWEKEDFLTYYLQGLEEEQTGSRAPYLAGIGEVGSAEHGKVVRPYLEADLPRLRRAAISALGRLSPKAESERLRGELLDALRDPFASVAKAGRDVIIRNRLAMPPDRLTRIAAGAEHPHTLRMAAQILHTTGKWTSIESFVRLADDKDGEDRELFLDHVDRWLRRGNRSFVTPSPEEATNLRRAVGEAADSLTGRGEAILQRLADAGG